MSLCPTIWRELVAICFIARQIPLKWLSSADICRSNRFVETWAEANHMNAIHYPEAYAEFHKTDSLSEAEHRVRNAKYWQATAVKVADVSIGAIDTVITKYNHLKGYFLKNNPFINLNLTRKL